MVGTILLMFWLKDLNAASMPERAQTDKALGVPTKNCYHLSSYGDTPDHYAWAKCMGVEYK